jgi:hypothetical protein
MSFCTDNFPDDPSIEAETSLFRRIPPPHCVWDNNEQRYRPSSAAFEDDKDGDPMSVCLSSVLATEGREAASVLIGHEGYSLAAITAGFARANAQTVHPQPLPEESSHTLVCGEKRRGGNNAPKRKFAKTATWVILNPPNAVAAAPQVAGD